MRLHRGCKDYVLHESREVIHMEVNVTHLLKAALVSRTVEVGLKKSNKIIHQA